MTNGDTVKLSLDIRDKDNNVYNMQSGDVIKMAVRKPKQCNDEFSIESESKFA